MKAKIQTPYIGIFHEIYERFYLNKYEEKMNLLKDIFTIAALMLVSGLWKQPRAAYRYYLNGRKRKADDLAEKAIKRCAIGTNRSPGPFAVYARI